MKNSRNTLSLTISIYTLTYAALDIKVRSITITYFDRACNLGTTHRDEDRRTSSARLYLFFVHALLRAIIARHLHEVWNLIFTPHTGCCFERVPLSSRVHACIWTDTCLSGRDTRDARVRKREGEGERKRTHSLLRPLILTEGDGVCTVRGCADGLRFRGRVKDTDHTSATAMPPGQVG